MKTTCATTFISVSNKANNASTSTHNNSFQLKKKASTQNESFIQSQSQMSGKTSGSARSKRKCKDLNKRDDQRQWKELRNKRLYGNFKSVSTD